MYGWMKFPMYFLLWCICLGFFCRADSRYRTHYLLCMTCYSTINYVKLFWLWNDVTFILRWLIFMLLLFILSHRMYEMATLVLYVHDVLMALSFQNSLFIIVQKKKFTPLFIIKYFQMVMLVPRAKVTTSNSIIWLKHSMGLLECYNIPLNSYSTLVSTFSRSSYNSNHYQYPLMLTTSPKYDKTAFATISKIP